MVDDTALSRHGRWSERGQAAIEFVLAMVIIIGLAGVLFQALHFELDVFNRSNVARFLAIRDIHDSPDEKDPETARQTIQGRNLDDLVPYQLPGQSSDGSLHYGPKTFTVRRGSKYYDPLDYLHNAFVFSGILLVDHYEDTAGFVGDAFEFLSSITDALNSI